jgi:hypothetical protein
MADEETYDFLPDGWYFSPDAYRVDLVGPDGCVAFRKLDGTIVYRTTEDTHQIVDRIFAARDDALQRRVDENLRKRSEGLIAAFRSEP